MENLDKFYRAYKYMRKLLHTDYTHNYIRQNLADADKGNDVLSGRINEKVIDMDWVVAIEDALPYIEKAIDEQRRFIKETQEVFRIDKAKIINKDSVKHLSQHTNFIAKVEGDMVTPNKVLTIEREESFEIYENRFLITLIRQALLFVTDKYRKMIDAPTDTYHKVEMERNLVLNQQKVNFKVEYSNEYKEEKATDLDVQDYEKLSDFDRVRRIREKLNAFLATPLMKEIHNSPAVRPPILHTNLMTKNPNFKAALDLYNYLTSYKKNGYEVIGKEYSGKMDEDVQYAMYFSMSFQHFMMTIATNSALKNLLEERYEEENAEYERQGNLPLEERKRKELELIEQVRREELKIRLAEIRDREKTIRLQQAEIKDIKRDIAARDRKIEQLESQIRALDEELKATKSELDKVKAELARALEKIKILEAKVAELEAKIVELEAKIAELEAIKEKLLAEVAQLKAKIQELEAVIEQQKARIQELEEIVAQQKARIAELEAAVAELEKIKAALENKVAVLEEENAKQKAYIAQLEAIKVQLENEVANLKDYVAQLESAKASLENRVQELEAETASQKATIAAHELTISQQKDNINSLEEKLTDANANIVTLTSTVAQRDTTISEQSATIDTLNNNISTLNTELDAEKTAHKADVDAEVEAHRNHVEKLNNMFESERTKIFADHKAEIEKQTLSNNKAMEALKKEHNQAFVKAEKKYENEKSKIIKDAESRVKAAQKEADKKAQAQLKAEIEKSMVNVKKAQATANEAASRYKEEFKREKGNIGLFKQDYFYGAVGVRTIMAEFMLENQLSRNAVLKQIANPNNIAALFFVKDKKRTVLYMGSHNEFTVLKNFKSTATLNECKSFIEKYLENVDKTGAYVTYSSMNNNEVEDFGDYLGTALGFNSVSVYNNQSSKVQTLGIYFYK